MIKNKQINNKKNLSAPPKQIFFSLQTQRLAESSEHLNSSLAQSLAKIFPYKNTRKLLVLG